MKNKILSALLVATMSIGLLAGCGGSSDSGSDTKETEDSKSGSETEDEPATETEDSTASGDPVTLTTVSMFGGTDPNLQTYEAIIEEYKTANPNVTIEDNSQTSDEEWKAAIAGDFSVGSEPDVLQFFTDANAEAVLATDKFVTVDEIKAEYPEYASASLPGAMDLAANPDGVQRAVPTTGFWEGLFCNKKLFDDNGIAIPTDWTSFIAAVEAFKAKDITPIAVSLNNVPHYWIEHFMLYASGKEEFEAIPAEGTAPEGWVKGLENFKALRDMGAFPVDTDTVDDASTGQQFRDGNVAMQLDGSWYGGNFADSKDVVVVAFPGVDGQKAEANSSIGGISSGFYITKKAWEDPAKKDAAVKFVMAHTSADALQRYWEASGSISTPTADVTPPDPASVSPFTQSAIDLVSTFKSETTSSATDSRLGQQAYAVLTSNIVKLSIGDMTAEDVVKEAVSKYYESK
jgi:raffinose/stachyose/melibiose transport system substrate-binding protein